MTPDERELLDAWARNYGRLTMEELGPDPDRDGLGRDLRRVLALRSALKYIDTTRQRCIDLGSQLGATKEMADKAGARTVELEARVRDMAWKIGELRGENTKLRKVAEEAAKVASFAVAWEPLSPGDISALAEALKEAGGGE